MGKSNSNPLEPLTAEPYCQNGLRAKKIEVRTGTDSTFFKKSFFVSSYGWRMLFWDKRTPEIA